MTHLFKIILLTIYLTFELVTSQCPVTSLPSGWNPINVPGSDYCYAISNTKTNQATARQECSENFKGILARFHDVTSLRALSKKIQVNTKRIWIDLIAKSNGNWIWTDGSVVDAAVLNEYYKGDITTKIDNTYCGTLTDASAQKYSEWTSEICTANHEFICQALKLNTNTKDCANSTFRIDNKCYAVTSGSMNFSAAIEKCRKQFHGQLASLGNRELAITVANYFNRKKPELKKVKVWLDIVWDKTKKRWQHSDGKKVTYHEENWYGSHKTPFAIDRTNAVLDQIESWKWKSWNPNWKAYAVCQVNSHESIKGKAVLPDLFTKSTKKNESPYTSNISTTTSMMYVGIDFKMLMLIAGAVVVVMIILIVIICVLCYRKKACCKRRKKKENYDNGFGTPVSFNFTNPDYDNLSNAVTGIPASATPSQRPPALPPRSGDETYATIIDEPISPPASTVDLLFAPIPSAYSTLSLARTTMSRERANENRSAASLARVDYSSRISLDIGGSKDSVVSRNRWNMTSFSNPEQHDVTDISPSYAQMSTSASGDQTVLQYAELNLGTEDEDEKFEIGAHSETNMNRRMTQQNGSTSQQLLPPRRTINNLGNITRQKFSQKYPDISRSGNANDTEPPNEYENETSPFVVSPDSPQFPL